MVDTALIQCRDFLGGRTGGGGCACCIQAKDAELRRTVAKAALKAENDRI